MGMLAIHDISGAMYKATGTPGLNTEVKGTLPIGGVVYLLKTIIDDVVKKWEVSLAFDSKSFRKELSGEYKKGRKKRPDIWVQLDLLKDLFDECGLPYMKEESYEADDLIYSCCQYWQQSGIPIQYVKTKIRINSTDLDLIHNLSDNNRVEFRGYTNLVPDITNKEEYELLYKGKLKYNTKTFYNILFGDSDFVERDDNGKKIPFTLEDGTTGKQIYERACFIIDKYNISGNNSRTSAFLDKVIATFNPTPNDIKNIERLKRIFFPVLVKDTNFNTVTREMIISDKFAEMIAAIRVPSLTRAYQIATRDLCFLKSESDKISDILGGYTVGNHVSNKYTELIKDYDRRYRSGSYMVDNNLGVNSVETEDSGVTLSEFMNIL